MKIIGHENTKKQLEVAVYASRQRNTSLPHMLFSGAPGCGKTSMARFVAQETEAPFISVVPNDLKDYKSVTKVLEQLDHSNYNAVGDRIGPVKPTVLFLDEVHNLPLKGQELLGLVMERFQIEANRPNKFHWVPYFTLVGATTIAGKLSKPFLDRFKLVFNFQPYEVKDMVKIIRYHATRMKVRATLSAISEIAKRSRGTPRTAVGFLERVRDRMISINSVAATTSLVKDVFDTMGVDDEGFTTIELRILKTLFNAGKPVSLDNLSVILQEDSKSIRDYAEPYLIRKGLILVSGKGRIITERGEKYLNTSGKADRLVKELIDFNYERK